MPCLKGIGVKLLACLRVVELSKKNPLHRGFSYTLRKALNKVCFEVVRANLYFDEFLYEIILKRTAEIV